MLKLASSPLLEQVKAYFPPETHQPVKEPDVQLVCGRCVKDARITSHQPTCISYITDFTHGRRY